MKRRTIFLAAGAALLALAGCGRQGGGNLAVVNGQPIPMEDFNNYLMRKPSVQVLVPNQGVAELQVATSLGFQGLRDLVNRTILMQIAKDEGVFPTQADVQEELDFQSKRVPDFVQRLTEQGLSLNMIKDDLLLDLSRERILTKGITVSEADVDKFIKENPDRFKEPALADLYWVVVSDPTKRDQVERDLRSGRPFQVVAAQYSVARDARRLQGKYPERVVNRMPPRLQDIVSRTAEGQTSAWLQDGTNYVRFYVQKKTPAREVPIDDTMKTFVRRQIAIERGMKANDLGRRLRDKLKEATIEVQVQALKDPWKNAFDRLKEEETPATTATQGAAGGTPTPAPTPAPGGGEAPKGPG